MVSGVRSLFRDLLQSLVASDPPDNEYLENVQKSQYQRASNKKDQCGAKWIFPEYIPYNFHSDNKQVAGLLRKIEKLHAKNYKQTSAEYAILLQNIEFAIGTYEKIKQDMISVTDAIDRLGRTRSTSGQSMDRKTKEELLPSYMTVLNIATEMYVANKNFETAFAFSRYIDDAFWPWDKTDPLYVKLRLRRARVYERLRQNQLATAIYSEYSNPETSSHLSVDSVLFLTTFKPGYWKEFAAAHDMSKSNLTEGLSEKLKHFFEGYVYFMEKDYTESLAKFVILNTASKFILPAILPVLAELSFLAGRKPESLEWFRTMRKSFPKILTNLDIYSLILYEQASQERLEALIMELNADGLADTLEYWIAIGFIATLKERHKQAIYCGSRAHQYNEQNVQAYLLKGINLESIRRFDDAIRNFQEVILVQPYRQDGYSCVVHCLIQEHKFSDALRVATQAVKELGWKNIDAISLYTVALFENSKQDRSMRGYCEEVATRALQLNPYHDNVIKILASFYMQDEKYRQVVELLEPRKSKMDMGSELIRTLREAQEKVRIHCNISGTARRKIVNFETPVAATSKIPTAAGDLDSERQTVQTRYQAKMAQQKPELPESDAGMFQTPRP